MPIVLTTPKYVPHDSYHVVFTLDDSTDEAIFYVNGVAETTTTFTYTLQTPVGVAKSPHIGALWNSSTGAQNHVDGSLQEMAVYNTVLSPTRVAAHYHAGLVASQDYSTTVLSDSPVQYWRLGESAGTTAADEVSSPAQDMTYIGSPTLGAAGLLPGDSGTSVDFNGTTHYVDSPGFQTASNVTDVTLELWMDIAVPPSSAVGMFHHGDLFVGGGQGYWFVLLSDGSLRVTTFASGDFRRVTSDPGIIT